VRAEALDALRAGHAADARTGALISLLQSVGAVTKVFDTTDGDTLRTNAERIADGDWASDAVRAAIRELMAAIIAATVSASVVAQS
jgi:hypothetical protein